MIRSFFYKTYLAGIIFLSGFSVSLCAQNNREYSVKKVHLPAAGKQTNESQLEVIVDLPDTSALGYISKENDVVEKLVPDTALQYWLQRYLQQKVNSGASKQLWVISDLSLQPVTDTRGYVKLKAKTYSFVTEEQEYTLNTTVDTILQMNIKSEIGEYVSAAMDFLVDQQVKRKLNATAEKRLVNRETSKSAKYTILTCKQYKTGIYTSFSDFISNDPAIIDFVILPEPGNTGKVKVYMNSPDSLQTEVKELWGISLNNELYYYNNGDIIPIEKSGNGFTLSAYIEPFSRVNQAMIRRNIIRQMEYLKEADRVVYRHDVKAPVAGITATSIDLNTGELSF